MIHFPSLRHCRPVLNLISVATGILAVLASRIPDFDFDFWACRAVKLWQYF